jgi:hypothetical protein
VTFRNDTGGVAARGNRYSFGRNPFGDAIGGLAATPKIVTWNFFCRK